MRNPERRRWLALGALALSVLVVGLDLTVLNLALPTLGTELHASTSDLQWFIDAYSLVLAAALLPAGLLGDRFGRKKVLIPALVLFGLASLACAYSHTAGELTAARAVLGLGAAVILPLSLAVIPVLFAPEERQKAIAVVMAAVFIGYPLGPILGGWLLDTFWWGSVFLINVPVIAIALVAVVVLMPESRSEHRPRLDAPGVAISSLGLTALVYGFIRAGEDGWGNAAALATILGGAAILAAFVYWERRVSRRPGGQPLVDLTLFQSAGFTWGTILATLVSFALFGILFAMPLYFRDVRGFDSLGAGLRLLPMIGGMIVGMVAGTRLQAAPKAPGGRARGRVPRAPGGRQDPRDGGVRGDGGGAGRRRLHQHQQRHRLRSRLVRRRRGRPRPGHAAGHERGPRRAVGRAQWHGLGRDHGVPAGGRDPGGRDPGHRAQLGLPGPAGPGRPARVGREHGAVRHLRRGGRGARTQLGGAGADR